MAPSRSKPTFASSAKLVLDAPARDHEELLDVGADPHDPFRFGRIVDDHRGGGGSQVSFGGQSELDLSGMPAFVAPRPALAEAVASSPVELGLLAAQSLLCVVFRFVGFLRYDVR